MADRKFFSLNLIILVIFLIWSVVNPYDYLTWFLEVFPVFLGLLILFLVYRYQNLKFTRFLYILMLAHAIILIIGGHYTYARMPLFDYFKEIFNLSRNHYDRLGHLMQGFVPALIVQEVILRKKLISENRLGWIYFFILCVVLAFSAFYEFIEWWGTVIFGSGANEFLGSQGDVWDAQWDMFFALIGGILALLFLGKFHRKQIRISFEDKNTKKSKQKE